MEGGIQPEQAALITEILGPSGLRSTMNPLKTSDDSHRYWSQYRGQLIALPTLNR